MIKKIITAKRVRKYSEEELLQQACVKWFGYQYPKYNKCLFHVQQKAKNAIEGAKFKQNGVVSGVSDLVLIAKGGKTYYIELKTPTGKQSTEQMEFQRQVTELMHDYVIVRSLTEFINFVNSKMRVSYAIVDHE